MDFHDRWILLEHFGSPDDPLGVHFDLLLEDGKVCRSWRLKKILVLDGPSQKVVPIPSHRLVWLDHSDGEVSGGRGWAKKVMAGFFLGELSEDPADPVQIELHSNVLKGNLEIKNFLCTLCSFRQS